MRKAWVSIALLISFVAGQAMGALDFAENEHQVCADHGELIHGPSKVQVAESRSEGWKANPSAESHLHDHCAYTLIRSGSDSDASVSHSVARLDNSAFVIQFEVARSKALQAIFQLAPKNSPPVSA